MTSGTLTARSGPEPPARVSTAASLVEPETRRIPCTGALGRRGECAVVVRGGRAIVTVPPGEAAQFTGPELSRLIEALRAARDELFRTDS